MRRIFIVTDGMIMFGPFATIAEAAQIADRLGLGEDWTLQIDACR